MSKKCSPTVIRCVCSCCELALLFKSQGNPHHPMLNPSMWINTSVPNLTPQTIRWVMFHLQANFALWEFAAIRLCRPNALFSVTQWLLPGKRRVSRCIVFLQAPINWTLHQQVEEEVSPLWTLFTSKSLPQLNRSTPALINYPLLAL